MENGGERDRLLELHPAFPCTGLFSRLVARVPLGAVLKNKGVQEETLFKKEVLKMQEQALPLYQKMSHQGGRSAWLNRKLWLDLRKKRRGRKLKRTTRMSRS